MIDDERRRATVSGLPFGVTSGLKTTGFRRLVKRGRVTLYRRREYNIQYNIINNSRTLMIFFRDFQDIFGKEGGVIHGIGSILLFFY